MKLFEIFGEISLKGGDETEQQIDKIDKKSGGLSKVLGGVGKVAMGAGALVGGAFATALADGVKGTIEMEKHTAQLDAVLKSTNNAVGMSAQEITAMADAFEKTTKFTAESTLEGQNLLLTFTKIGQDVFPQATETMLNMAQAMGTDASSQAIALGKALNDPIAGVASLGRVGVQFSEEQKAMIDTMMQTGDIAGAQSVILKELETQFGGSAEAAGKTFAGQLEIAKNSIGKLTEGMAAGFMPVLQGALEWINAHMPEIQAFMTGAFDAIGGAVSVVVDWFNIYMMPVFKELYDFAVEMFPYVKQSFETVFDAIMVVATEVWTFFKENLLPILSTILDYIVDNFPAIQKTFENVFGVAADVLGILWELFKRFWEWVEPTFPLIGAIIESTFGVIGDVINDVVDDFKSLVAWIKSALDWLNKFTAADKNATFTDSGTGNGLGLSQYLDGTRAMGGPVNANGTYLVGEKGPEIFTPNQSGSIIPNGSLGGITVSTMIVREEADIQRISRELYNLQVANQRGGGY